MLVWCPKSGASTPPVGGGSGPSIGSVVTKSATVNVAAVSITIPSTIATGELMLVAFSCYEGECATPSGWTLQQSPPNVQYTNIYVFSRIKVAGDSAVTLTRTGTGNSAAAVLIGIKDGKTVHRNATPIEASINVAGSTLPVVANSVAPALVLWMAASFTTSNADMTWAPDKPRVAAIAGDVTYTYYSVLSIVSKLQSAAGDSEATKVAADPARVLGTMNTLSITA